MGEGIAERFAQAIADKDRAALLDVLDPAVDFRALTPGKCWEATSAEVLVDDVILGSWLDAGDHIEALEDVQTGSVVDRGRLAYLLRVRNPLGVFLVEQQAYYEVADDRISWLRILCSGFRPLGDAAPA